MGCWPWGRFVGILSIHFSEHLLAWQSQDTLGNDQVGQMNRTGPGSLNICYQMPEFYVEMLWGLFLKQAPKGNIVSASYKHSITPIPFQIEIHRGKG